MKISPTCSGAPPMCSKVGLMVMAPTIPLMMCRFLKGRMTLTRGDRTRTRDRPAMAAHRLAQAVLGLLRGVVLRVTARRVGRLVVARLRAALSIALAALA